MWLPRFVLSSLRTCLPGWGLEAIAVGSAPSVPTESGTSSWCSLQGCGAASGKAGRSPSGPRWGPAAPTPPLLLCGASYAISPRSSAKKGGKGEVEGEEEERRVQRMRKRREKQAEDRQKAF